MEIEKIKEMTYMKIGYMKYRKEEETMKRIKESLFELGILIICVTIFCERLFVGENNVTLFFMGLGCGLEIIGAIIKIINKK